VLILEERHYDKLERRLKSEWTFARRGKVEKRSLSIRLYTYRELCTLFEQEGFGRPKAFGSLTREPFEIGSPRLYLSTTIVEDM